MNAFPLIEVRRLAWQEGKQTLSAIRYRVFVEEQGVPASLEADEFDEICIHVLAQTDAGERVGCGRLLLFGGADLSVVPPWSGLGKPGCLGKIGRMAVLHGWRDRGVGGRLLAALLQDARSLGLSEVFLSAQTRAIGFYLRAGFVCEGPEYEEAGIPHQKMRLVLL